MDVVPNTPAASTSGSSSSTSLSSQRAKSSIPLAAADSVPKHQDGQAEEVWVYPSEQQFFNAMRRKVNIMAMKGPVLSKQLHHPGPCVASVVK